MTRRDGSRTFPIVMTTAVLVLTGCGGHLGILKPKPSAQPEDDGGVDTSLSALRRDQDPVAADPGEFERIPEDTSTRARVEESARLMEGYFRELDAAAQGRADAPALEPERVSINADPVERPAETTIRSPDPIVRETTPELDARPDPENAGIGDTFSLSAAMNEREGDGSEGGGAETEAPVDAPIETAEEVAVEPETDPVPVDPEARKKQLVTELVDVLTQVARESEDPSAAAIDLAALESMGAGTLEQLHEQGVLSNSEMATLGAARDVLRSISSSGSIASPAEVSEVLARVKSELDERAGLRITRAALCTSVAGFGRYEPFAKNEFVAGSAQQAIVYTEVDRFGYREFAGADGEPRYEVELSQRLELYHVADDLNTWNRAAEVISETSRNKVRDFYLINQITLPRTLGPGSYHLKVVMRDLVRQTTSEMIIPIRILAR